jgi:hypothetical protein
MLVLPAEEYIMQGNGGIRRMRRVTINDQKFSGIGMKRPAVPCAEKAV